ncbi:unnamed protein product [Blepharisma stoltei]|uniref:Uncharacterized protein n=1 Tax=Blepharisma stoltei TaxID=1481888 RepID=A0AAU9IDI8_9CILI|nr:unnamed protein product [Blepharisma stoltei]
MIELIDKKFHDIELSKDKAGLLAVSWKLLELVTGCEAFYKRHFTQLIYHDIIQERTLLAYGLIKRSIN